jgi:hypothetical protein
MKNRTCSLIQISGFLSRRDRRVALKLIESEERQKQELRLFWGRRRIKRSDRFLLNRKKLTAGS